MTTAETYIFRCLLAYTRHTLTNMSVTQHLQQAGLLAARGRGEGGGQLAEVKLSNVQWDICG